MSINNLSISGGERPRLMSLPPSDEQSLLKRFPEEGLAYDAAKIIESVKRTASARRSGRWQIEYSPNLRQAEVLFSRNPQDTNYKREGIIVRGDELSVYTRTDGNQTSSRVVFRDGVIERDAPIKVKVAAMRALRTLRLAPQLNKNK